MHREIWTQARDWAQERVTAETTSVDALRLTVRGGIEAHVRGIADDDLDEWADGLDAGLAHAYSLRAKKT